MDFQALNLLGSIAPTDCIGNIVTHPGTASTVIPAAEQRQEIKDNFA